MSAVYIRQLTHDLVESIITFDAFGIKKSLLPDVKLDRGLRQAMWSGAITPEWEDRMRATWSGYQRVDFEYAASLLGNDHIQAYTCHDELKRGVEALLRLTDANSLTPEALNRLRPYAPKLPDASGRP